MSRFGLLAAIAIAACARDARAQCPDGTPQPCRGAASRPTPPPFSVAVLTFENRSRDTADAYIGEGLADEIATELGSVARLTVRSRSMVRRLRGADTMTTAALGRALNAAYLVTGGVQRSGAQLRVSVELMQVATGVQAWAHRYDRAARDLFAVQSDVAQAVGEAVAGRLLPEERARLAQRPTRSSAAYDLYVRGQVVLRRSNDLLQAAALFDRAVRLDSTYAMAWSALSQAHAQTYWVYIDRSDARLALAGAAAERARSLAPDAVETHLALGYVHYWGNRDYDLALAEFRAALAARAADPAVRFAIANVLRRQGRWEASIAERAQGLALDPGNPTELTDAAYTLVFLRRFREADSLLLQAFREGAPNPLAYGLHILCALAQGAPPTTAPTGGDFVAAHPDLGSANVLHDPHQLLPLVRMVPEIGDGALHAPAGATAEEQAGLLVMRGEVLVTRNQSAPALAAYDSARIIMEAMVAQRPSDDGLRAALGLVYARIGRRADAAAEAEAATRLLPLSLDAAAGAQHLQSQAQVLILIGEHDRALELLEQLLRVPSFVTPALLRTDPIYAPLLGNPRFERLVARN